MSAIASQQEYNRLDFSKLKDEIGKVRIEKNSRVIL